MTDILMLAILVAFFGLAFVFVKACERIVGPDIEAVRAEGTPTQEASTDDGAVAA